jgi:hypothetical protein
MYIALTFFPLFTSFAIKHVPTKSIAVHYSLFHLLLFSLRVKVEQLRKSASTQLSTSILESRQRRISSRHLSGRQIVWSNHVYNIHTIDMR